MLLDNISLLLQKIFEIYKEQLPIIFGLACLFAVMSIFKSHASDPNKVWWRSRGLATDIAYALIHGIAAPYFKLPALVLAYALLSSTVMTQDEVAAFFRNGGGPLHVLPFWGQVIVQLLVADLFLYWLHRIFHGNTLWRYHAVHHSSEDLDWMSAYRSHPINVIMQPALVSIIMLTLGISPAVMAFLLPFDIITAAWVHSNLNWTLGPLKYVIATPVFHRWHHTLPDEGGNSNFAPTFSFWDYIFGTFYMPEGKIPQDFGCDDPHLPEGYFKQLLYPFRPKGNAAPSIEPAE
ncbi:MAG: sterol desaturase family protein [Hyphomicrobium sp.]|uniref:sterol desaturase family protein n=1 Tax=Hyphomicrobium sp. TaxID=82 RepID=UPI0039E576C2